jgi:hypothetical protein
MGAVKSFMDSTCCQWSGSVEALYLLVIGRQGD